MTSVMGDGNRESRMAVERADALLRNTRCAWAGGTTEFSRIIDQICWSCFFCFVFYVKFNTTLYVRTYVGTTRIYRLTDGLTDRRTDGLTDELIWGGLGPTVPPG